MVLLAVAYWEVAVMVGEAKVAVVMVGVEPAAAAMAVAAMVVACAEGWPVVEAGREGLLQV